MFVVQMFGETAIGFIGEMRLEEAVPASLKTPDGDGESVWGEEGLVAPAAESESVLEEVLDGEREPCLTALGDF